MVTLNHHLDRVCTHPGLKAFGKAWEELSRFLPEVERPASAVNGAVPRVLD